MLIAGKIVSQQAHNIEVRKMKRKIIVCIAILGLLGMTGCGKTGQVTGETENVSVQIEPDTAETLESEMKDSSDAAPDTVAPEQSNSADKENSGTGGSDELEIDFTYDYTEDIKADVDYTVSNSASLQEELENMEKVIQKYNPLAESAQTQGEMNISSKWFFVVWDTELNSLWDRFSNSADQQTKENVLAEQRKWISMKEEVVYDNIGSSEENGSMYPLLVNSFLEEITQNRAYVLASELAKVKGESFVMPEKSTKYGTFVDNQGTGSVYGSLVTRPGLSGEDEAVMSIYRLGKIEGTFVDNGNGELAFTSDTWNIKGIIRINGWDGASFKVTEAPSDSLVSVGEEFTFPFVF